MRTRSVTICGLFLAGAICLSAAERENQTKTTAKKPWPKDRKEAQGAVDAFTAALTRAGYDQGFRDRLKASPESARDAVSDEGNIDIPKDIMIIFHEPDLCQNYWPFYLPELKETVGDYVDYFQGCFSRFRLRRLADVKMKLARTGPKGDWNQDNIASAFSAVLQRAAREEGFRSLLLGDATERGTSAALQSAAKAVSEEGNIQIPPGIVILFHEGIANEKYHMFSLPPFDEKKRDTYEYRAYFDGFYFVW